MNRRSMFMASAVAAALAVASAMAANAETISLQIKRLEAATGRSTGPPSEAMFRGGFPQRVSRQVGANVPVRPGGEGQDEFGKIITKEPSYNSKTPFRGVASLGTQKFGFVLDTAKAEDQPQPQPKAPRKAPVDPFGGEGVEAVRYSRLLFDLNHNGDLTDDPVIEAPASAGGPFGAGYQSFSFPRVDLTVDVDGTKIDYAFLLSGYSYGRMAGLNQPYQYAIASLNAAAYREGEITLDGQKVRIVVTDYNSNGRFDDLSAPNPNVNYGDGSVYLQPGDMIYVDPQPQGAYGYDPTMNDAQHHLAKVIHIGGRFYDLQITPAGDKLTLTPSALEVGHVSNPSRGYRGLVFGDLGVMKITGDADGRAALPVGSWNLQSYTIDRTGYDEPEGQADAGPSLLQSLAGALLGREQATRPRFTMVSARMTGQASAFEVRPGETTELRFGPPYTPKVTASYQRGDQVSLGLSLVGVGGEVCSNLVVDGGRPAKPKFTITDPDGKIVATGDFEYG